MASVTLSRGSTSVTIPIVEAGGEPLIVTALGKPTASFQSVQALNPRYEDFRSGLEQYQINGRFTGSSAFADALSLADLIKQPSDGFPLTIEFNGTLPELPGSAVDVAPAPESNQALSLAYDPGYADHVDIQLTVARVSSTVGTDANQTASTPTASGTGPIKVSDGNTTVSLSSDVAVERAIGRPASKVSPTTTEFPRYVDKPKAAEDVFSISLEVPHDPSTVVSDLRTLVSQQLGRGSLTLNFNGLFNMGSFDVAPPGSGPLRHIRRSGYGGSSAVPTLQLRRITT